MGKSGLRGDPSEFAMPTAELVLLFVPDKHFVLVLCVLLSGERSKDTGERGRLLYSSGKDWTDWWDRNQRLRDALVSFCHAVVQGWHHYACVTVSSSETSLLVEFGGEKCLEKLLSSGVPCALFQINLTCLLKNSCGCRAMQEQEWARRCLVGRKLWSLPKLQWSSNKAKRGKEALLWPEECVCVLSALQKLHWELLTAVVLPWSWHRSPLVY